MTAEVLIRVGSGTEVIRHRALLTSLKWLHHLRRLALKTNLIASLQRPLQSNSYRLDWVEVLTLLSLMMMTVCL